MALPPAAPERLLKHRRRIDVHVHARGQGRWEVDAEIVDTKTCDTQLAGGQRPFPIDRCQALRADGQAVKLFYPRWYRGAVDPAAASTPIETRASETLP